MSEESHMPQPASDADEAASTPAEGAANGRGRGSASHRLDAARGRLGVEPDGVIARSLGIARKTVVEYRKRHGIGAYGAAPTPGEALATRRASRLDAFATIVGTLPDRVVAERAGVTPENVRMYRQRRNIAARWRDDGPPAVVTRKGRAGAGGSRVDEALAPLRDIVGALPDAEVAARAGVSRSAVAAWRGRQGIPGTGGRRSAEVSADSTSSAEPALLLWRVVAVRDGERKVYGLLAAGPVEAATRAQAAIEGRRGWSLRSLKVVGEALPE